jgi:hypothetical protein
VSVLFFLQLVTDLDVLLPLIDEARRRERDLGGTIAACITSRLQKKFPHVAETLERRGLDVDVVDGDAIVAGRKPKLEKVRALVCATETTAPPHKAAHALALRANAAGVRTCTLQHGFENIGLTYFDAENPPDAVRFASQRIFVWGPLSRLHRDVLPETRARCLAVGCWKPVEKPASLAIPGARAHLVGLFENLHWSRYSPNYVSRFLDGLAHVVAAFPDTTFLVKPHPSGKWWSERADSPRPRGDNLLLAAPGDDALAEWSNARIFSAAAAIVTTPSTIALDAARAGTPVAVALGDLPEQELAAYAPLPLLRGPRDWHDFVAAARSPESRAGLASSAASFANAAFVPGDAAARVIDRIVLDLEYDSD